uniref:Uncharacterized protein n=1 Tax=Anguilla anguilla TaxID=7936 RepID=A0A0E9VMD4_ANGAN
MLDLHLQTSCHVGCAVILLEDIRLFCTTDKI